ncbi:MAG: hypothetical protein WC096_00530 [Sphaerochaetaceae bacterium]
MTNFMAASGAFTEASGISGQISGGLDTVLGLSDTTLKYVTMTAGIAQLVGGVQAGWAAYASIMEARNTKAAAEAAALTATVAADPLTVWMVGVAGAAVAVGAAVTYSLMDYKIKADTSSAADRGRINAIAGGI